jgi:iron-sulfur cluster assembly accessory protein
LEKDACRTAAAQTWKSALRGCALSEPLVSWIQQMDSAVQSESVVTVTESAAGQIKEIWAGDAEKRGKPLRIFVESGGCSGMQYGMDFDEEREGDFAGQFHGVGVVVDRVSAEYLRGAVIDYVDALTGGGFKIKNPRAKQSCGCGKSFEA